VRGEREPTDDRHDLQNIFPHTEPSNLLGDWSEEQRVRGKKGEGKRGQASKEEEGRQEHTSCE
jgi:hypothetical protein